MNLLFTAPHCEYCKLCRKAVLAVNPSLPLGKRIDVVNVYSGDTRINALYDIFSSDNSDDWLIPILVIERPTKKRKIDNLIKGKNQIIVYGITDYEHYKRFIKYLILT